MGRVFYLSKSKLVIQACITHSSGTLLGEGIQFFLSGLEFKKKKVPLCKSERELGSIEQSQPSSSIFQK